MTQIGRFAHMRKLRIDKVRGHVEVHISREGSLLGGTIEASVDRVQTRYEIDSPEDRATVAALVRAARSGCFVRAAIRKTVVIEDSDRLNGEPLALD